MKKYLIALLIGITGTFTSISAQLTKGVWRGAIIRNDGQPVYFNFEVSEKNKQPVLHFINASEKIRVDDIRIEGDSLWFEMPFYESSFKARKEADGSLKGVWQKRSYSEVVSLPFEAVPGIKKRFPATEGKALSNISGLWQVVLSKGDGTTRNAVATFSQKNNQLTGSFVTSTGDYRFLEGIVSGHQLRLSTFDGGLLYYFEADIAGDSIVNGTFYMGSSRVDSWRAEKNPNAALPADSVTPSILSSQPVQFNFKDVEGNLVSLDDPRFDNKVIVLQIMGSWCPNCMDETRFLSEVYDEYRKKGVEIIGLAYELSTDFERSQRSLQRVIERFQVKYPVLITGLSITDDQKTQKSLPQISDIKTYPTTVFLNRQKQVVGVHTGFAGPGTGVFYDEYKKHFRERVEALL